MAMGCSGLLRVCSSVRRQSQVWFGLGVSQTATVFLENVMANWNQITLDDELLNTRDRVKQPYHEYVVEITSKNAERKARKQPVLRVKSYEEWVRDGCR